MTYILPAGRFALPPLTSVTTGWYAPWLVSALAEHGEIHFDADAPYQDAYAVVTIGEHLVLAVADGMSSGELSHHGARIAVDTAVASLTDQLGAGLPSTEQIEVAFAAAHKAIARRAQEDGRQTHHYATTLALAVVTGTHIAAGAVGDSSISVHTVTGKARKSMLSPFVSAPQPVENTLSLSETYWRGAFTARAARYPALKTVIVNSDGGNGLFTSDSDGTDDLHLDPSYFDGLPELLESYGARTFAITWAAYLMQRPATKRDDRTILVAYQPDTPLTIRG